MIDAVLSDTLSQHISAESNKNFTLDEHQAIGGGSINDCYKISGNGKHYFLKTNNADLADMFAAEASGLHAIVDSNTILAPKPICYGETDTTTYLILEYLELGTSRKQNDQDNIDQFGEQLATMHRNVQTRYGWKRNNTIGSTPQINTHCDNWSEFFREHRLGYQINLASENGHHGQFIDKAHELLEYVDQLLYHNPPASLLHGDLWSGNYGITSNGLPAIFDPAVYYGDSETDMAMTELFGNFPPRFYDAYWHHHPKEAEYSVRKTLYNLYHILNHLNLFGDGYYSQADHMMSALLSEVR
ncbi:MAG: fructosamine kinase family protein [Gammaproteobacteria bacterium]|nr:fructosamine kinase family protein [Gammaproteobacteria bacterium]